MMERLLEFKDYICGYGQSFRLKEINFEVDRGDFTGIIGPNGSGKTTLLKGITGELNITGGSATYMGESLPKLSLAERARHFAVVSQFSDPVDISVEEYVLMGRIPYRSRWQYFESQEDYSIAEKYMRLTGIVHLKNKLLTSISGGEMQLAGIARALAQEPEILLLDEATAHLDISHQVQVLNLLRRLNREMNLTVLMVIHDLNLAGEYCDKLIMMDRGGVYIKGDPHKVLRYDHIEEVYKTVVVTRENPLSGKPVIFLVSEKVLNKR